VRARDVGGDLNILYNVQDLLLRVVLDVALDLVSCGTDESWVMVELCFVIDGSLYVALAGRAGVNDNDVVAFGVVVNL
jgi:hypothetical protein